MKKDLKYVSLKKHGDNTNMSELKNETDIKTKKETNISSEDLYRTQSTKEKLIEIKTMFANILS